MAIVEVVSEDESSQSSEEVLKSVENLSASLRLPPKLGNGQETSESRRYIEQTLLTLHKIVEQLRNPAWQEVAPDDQAKAIENVLQLYGEDAWSSSDIRAIIDDGVTPHLAPFVPIEILKSLRQYFSAHPSLSSSSRALSRPSGGPDSTIDMHDSQPFKAGGVSNLLLWSVKNISDSEVERWIGLILPPTLVMMDDWEPFWRARGASILDEWMGKLDTVVMKRMGVDKLLLRSLVHTLSLHPNPPLQGVLEITLRLAEKTLRAGSEERTNVYVEIAEKAIVQGWVYAASGLEGRVVLIDITEKLEVMCGVFGVGIIRWLKPIIPSLLGPLQYPPTTPVLPHYQANLSALLCVMRTVRPTDRLARWRGQILNVLSRLAVQLQDRRGLEVVDCSGLEKRVHSLVKDVFVELANQVPSVKHNEYPRLVSLSPNTFSDLVHACR